MTNFENPTSEYRPLSFWSWNGRLREEELRRQIMEMKEQGWGGFFMHARTGLETEYLSEEWMSMVEAAVKEASRLGLEAWLYDENGWPSGTAGGIVPRLDPALRETHLMMAKGRIPYREEDVRILAVYEVEKQYGIRARSYGADHLDVEFRNFLRSDLDSLGPADKRADCVPDYPDKEVLFFFQWRAPLGNARFNGASYVDLLHPGTADAFIASTHEQYAARFGSRFGGVIPGIFMDDLTLVWNIWGMKSYALPWTEGLEEMFAGEYGYSLTEYLPHLYYELEGYRKVRLDYYRLVNRLFARNWTQRINDWCLDKGLISTGHLMGGSRGYIDPMQHYEHMGSPATDHLAFQCKSFAAHRLAQSAASQLGKTRVVCEVYAACGQDLTFEGQKWIADWLFIHGINQLVMHLSLYDMAGHRKRDHPPTLSWQQPWWPYNHVMAGYQARLSYMLSCGRRMADILVIHPVESVGVAYTPLDPRQSEAVSGKYERMLQLLLESHRDFELGSEELMERYGAVRDGKLYVGQSCYQTVLLPGLLTLRGAVARLLENFMEAGGLVIACGEVPAAVDDSPGPGSSYGWDQASFMQRVRTCPIHMLEEVVRESTASPVTVTGMDGKPAAQIFLHMRQTADSNICFLINHSRKQGCRTRLLFPGKWNITMLDPATGIESAASCTSWQGNTYMEHEFPPVGSLLLKLTDADKDLPGDGIEQTSLLLREPGSVQSPAKPLQRQPEEAIFLHENWRLKLLDHNALTLDYCTIAGIATAAPAPMHHMKAHAMIMEHKQDFILEYQFQVKGWTEATAWAVVERPEQCRYIEFNGQRIQDQESGWRIDPSFRKFSLAGLVRQGLNTLRLSCAWHEKAIVEPVYIEGDFRVEGASHGAFVLVSPRENCSGVNLAREGYCFYAGQAELSQAVRINNVADRRFRLELVGMDAVCVEVLVNGKSAGVIAWKPYTLDITGLVQPGENGITLRLVPSLHNLLGPHHIQQQEEKKWIGPASFDDKSNWSDFYHFVPFGVSGAGIRISRSS
ncbi:MAG: hypothetical protein K0R57_6238 [Paenibacillaceae bacterium]|jgi:hypothetical protein|nr:hypothetical protein [Paenibacillaceae bacterium]